jgi:HEAT repeat protein
MKTDDKQLFRDLRAAVMLGKPEAVDIALDGLLRLPGVSSNDRMSNGFIQQIILPVGEALAGLRSPQLRPMLTHQLAVGRAVGAVALAHRYVNENDATPKDLRHPGSDTRQDVRLALGKALVEVSMADPEKTIDLGKTWITDPAPKLRATALIFIPTLIPKHKDQIMNLLGTLGTDENPEVRAALVDALITLARNGYPEQVLGLLFSWASEHHPNSWVICRTLSASWASDHPCEVESILRTIQSRKADAGHIDNALKSLKRHGIDISL